jgi:hypothetical protein
MVVLETTVNEVAAVPPKLTAVAPVKFVPVMVMIVPLAALAGANEEMVGGGMKTNPARRALPPRVVTETRPDVPFATTAVILVDEFTVKELAAVPPKLTAVAPVKWVPIMVTVAPLAAVVGVNEVIVGEGTKVKPARVATPPGVET